jgi:hypothetical protein
MDDAHSGLRVRRNQPYAGGFTTQRYGRPALARHTLQIEINRALYMDEARHERLTGRGRHRATDDRPARRNRPYRPARPCVRNGPWPPSNHPTKRATAGQKKGP